jgi:flagellar hook-associated protein 3 FlgL
MRIVFNSSFNDGIRAIQTAAASLASAQQQVSSGRRINVPSDDPIGSTSAIADHASLDRLDAYSSAADAAAYRLGLADSTLSDIVNQLTSAQSTALAARGTAPNQQQRDAAAQSLLAIRDALLGDINTKFQGTYIFSGSNVTVPPFTQTGSTISAYQGDSAATSVDIETGRTAATTFDGGALFQGSDSQHVLDSLTDLAAAVSAGDDTAISSGVEALGRAFDRATAVQAQVGNNLTTIDDSRARLASEHIGVVARLESVENVDLADAATKMAQADTAYRAALSSLATIGRVSLMDYLK